MAARTEGIDLRPDGTIELVINGQVRHLRRPTVGEVREWTEQVRELGRKANEEVFNLNQMLVAAMDEKTDDTEIDRLRRETSEAESRRMEYLSPWMSAVVETLSDKPLPDDVETWPAYLVMDMTLPTLFLKHWKTAPLVHGGTSKT